MDYHMGLGNCLIRRGFIQGGFQENWGSNFRQETTLSKLLNSI